MSNSSTIRFTPIKSTTLLILYSVIFLGSAGFFITIPAYVDLFMGANHTLVQTDMPLSTRREWFGIVMSLAPFISMFFTPLIARFSDIYGRKHFMLGALVIAGIGFFLPITAIGIGSIALLFVGNVLNSIGSSSQPIAQAALAEMSTGRRKATLMSLVAVVMTAAMSFGPALGSKVLALYGPSAPFYTCLLLAALNFLLLLMLVRRQELQHTTHYEHQSWALLDPIKRSASGLLPSLIIVFLSQFSWSLYFQNLSFLLPEKWHVSITSQYYQGYMMAIGLIMIIALLSLPNLLLKRFSLSQCLTATFIIGVIGMILLAIAPTLLTQSLAMIPVAIVMAIAFPFYISRVSENASEQDQGTAMALASALVGLAWTLSGYLTAVFANISLILPMLVASVCLCLVLIILPKTKNKSVVNNDPL